MDLAGTRALRSSGPEQGIALVTTLLLLMLLSAVTVGMVLAASSDELINGYYRNMRGSFYAADSGLNIARETMRNQLAAAVPETVANPAIQPITPGTEATIATTIESTYSSNTSMNSGEAANSWPASYRITDATLTLVSCLPSGGTGGGTCASPTGSPTRYSYNYEYSLTAVGATSASELTTVTDRGNLLVDIDLTSGGTTTSFAAWGFFVDNFDLCGSLTLVPGTITGPAFSNDSWTFGTSGSYIFTDPVGAHNANLGYRFSSSRCYSSPNDPYTYSGTTINPDFQAGYTVGAPEVDLPEDSFSQKRAVLDGMGTNDTDPSNAEMHAVLRSVSTVEYPSGGASSGVFLPYTLDTTSAGCPAAASCKVMTGGGILVEGNATVTLTASTADADRQVVTIVQSGTTTTVTIDLSSNTTTIASGATTTVVTGVPTQKDALGNPVRDATMVYVDGNITALKGPGSGAAAIQDSHALSVVAASDITITDDIKYKTKPVTTAQNEIPGTPPATLIPGNDNGQVLGIYTNGGDIHLNNCSGCGALDIHASLASLDQGGNNTINNTGSTISTLNILGGRIQNNMGNINTTTRNVYFDRRFSQGGFAPPWFPSTTLTSTTTGTDVDTSIQRVQWLNQTPF
jgi:Tfp pilus assembly protein PilX